MFQFFTKARFLVLLLLSATAVGCGCAGHQSSPAVSSPAVSVTPDSIQTLMADIEQQLGVMARSSECLDRCRAASSICDSSERICIIARDLAELDALESCRRAEDYCSEARRVVDEECSCPSSISER